MQKTIFNFFLSRSNGIIYCLYFDLTSVGKIKRTLFEDRLTPSVNFRLKQKFSKTEKKTSSFIFCYFLTNVLLLPNIWNFVNKMRTKKFHVLIFYTLKKKPSFHLLVLISALFVIEIKLVFWQTSSQKKRFVSFLCFSQLKKK